MDGHQMEHCVHIKQTLKIFEITKQIYLKTAANKVNHDLFFAFNSAMLNINYNERLEFEIIYSDPNIFSNLQLVSYKYNLNMKINFKLLNGPMAHLIVK